MTKIVVPTTQTVISSAWGKTVADGLNLLPVQTAFAWYRFTPNLVAAPNQAPTYDFNITTPFASQTVILTAIAQIMVVTKSSEQSIGGQFIGGGAAITPVDYPRVDSWIGATFNSDALTVAGLWSAVTAGVKVIRLQITAGGGAPSVKLTDLTVIMHAQSTTTPL